MAMKIAAPASRAATDRNDTPTDRPMVGLINPSRKGEAAPVRNANMIMMPEAEPLSCGAITSYRAA